MPRPRSKILREKCLTALQLLVRLKAADDNGYVSCVTCGVTRHYKDGMQGGHFLPRGTAHALLEQNVNPQCQGCNGFGMKHGSAAQAYTSWMIDMYGKDYVDELIATKSQVNKMTVADYEDLLEDLKAQIKIQEARVI